MPEPVRTVSEGEWLAVSTEGFMEQQRGRPLAHLVKELVQNALDSVGGRGLIDLEVLRTGPRTAAIRCVDDGPGAADLGKLNVVFMTSKKDGVRQRGRMGRGFKELLSIAARATVRSCGEELEFTVGEDGVRRVTRSTGLDWLAGFRVSMDVEHDEAGEDLAGYFRTFLPPEGVILLVNGDLVQCRPPHRTLDARLTTERFAAGRWEKPTLKTAVHLVPTAEGETALIYEMGIPVCPVEWGEQYHCDVQQRVPQNPNRDAVMSGYPARLHRACLPALLPEMSQERALAAWVGEAAVAAGNEVQKAVVERAFGEAVVRAVPVRGRFDHNADAEELGQTVIHTAHMSGGFRKLLQQQVPTAAQVAIKAQEQSAAEAVGKGLTREEVEGLDLADRSHRCPELVATIGLRGRDAVLQWMDFTQWFAEAAVAARHGRPRAVPVRVAWLPGVEATWSTGGVLTLSLAHNDRWGSKVTPRCFTILVHEIAHHEAFHHGHGFPKEVEAYAGAALSMMLERSGELRRWFPGMVAPLDEADGGCPDDAEDVPMAGLPSRGERGELLRSVSRGSEMVRGLLADVRHRFALARKALGQAASGAKDGA